MFCTLFVFSRFLAIVLTARNEDDIESKMLLAERLAVQQQVEAIMGNKESDTVKENIINYILAELRRSFLKHELELQRMHQRMHQRDHQEIRELIDEVGTIKKEKESKMRSAERHAVQQQVEAIMGNKESDTVKENIINLILNERRQNFFKHQLEHQRDHPEIRELITQLGEIKAEKKMLVALVKHGTCSKHVWIALEYFNKFNSLTHGVICDIMPNAKRAFDAIKKTITTKYSELKKITATLSDLSDEDVCEQELRGKLDNIENRLKKIEWKPEPATELKTALSEIRKASDHNEPVRVFKKRKSYWRNFNYVETPWEVSDDNEALYQLALEVQSHDNFKSIFLKENVPDNIERYIMAIIRNERLSSRGEIDDKKYDECMSTFFYNLDWFSYTLNEMHIRWPDLGTDDTISKFCLNFAQLYNIVNLSDFHSSSDAYMAEILDKSCTADSKDYEAYLRSVCKKTPGADKRDDMVFVGLIVAGKYRKHQTTEQGKK